jgi:hypothetical protein
VRRSRPSMRTARCRHMAWPLPIQLPNGLASDEEATSRNERTWTPVPIRMKAISKAEGSTGQGCGPMGRLQSLSQYACIAAPFRHDLRNNSHRSRPSRVRKIFTFPVQTLGNSGQSRAAHQDACHVTRNVSRECPAGIVSASLLTEICWGQRECGCHADCLCYRKIRGTRQQRAAWWGPTGRRDSPGCPVDPTAEECRRSVHGSMTQAVGQSLSRALP